MVKLAKSYPTRLPLSFKDYYENKDKILIIRETGGLGDILMHRMIFEDIKILSPDAEIHFACPAKYFDAVYDHPFIDKVLDSYTLDRSKYVVHYITTTACGRYESNMAPYSTKNRSDIWANHCGFKLTKHEMHIRLEQNFVENAKKRLEKENAKGRTAVICPISAMITKNLLPEQQKTIVETLRLNGFFVYALHHRPIPELEEMGVPVWSDLSVREWMGAISASDCVISVDTAAFHYAGGIKKPLVGVFTFADGKIYGKYYDFILVQKHRDNGDWACGPCYSWPTCPKSSKQPKPCLTSITSEMLINGIKNMLDKWSLC